MQSYVRISVMALILSLVTLLSVNCSNVYMSGNGAGYEGHKAGVGDLPSVDPGIPNPPSTKPYEDYGFARSRCGDGRPSSIIRFTNMREALVVRDACVAVNPPKQITQEVEVFTQPGEFYPAALSWNYVLYGNVVTATPPVSPSTTKLPVVTACSQGGTQLVIRAPASPASGAQQATITHPPGSGGAPIQTDVLRLSPPNAITEIYQNMNNAPAFRLDIDWNNGSAVARATPAGTASQMVWSNMFCAKP